MLKGKPTEFGAIDPLEAKQSTSSDVAANALKKEISNILSSYVGWYDPFCELIQNALDSVEERQRNIEQQLVKIDYTPTIKIRIDVRKTVNSLTVTDNGIGLSDQKFRQFLAPSFSFKSGKNVRGHKGVGATFLAYGFNYIQIATKCEGFETVGQMKGARNWLTDDTPSGNPQLFYDAKGCDDPTFAEIDSGVSITLKFDKTTHPRSLDWLKANTAEQWKNILLTKTGLGSFFKNPDIEVNIEVVGSDEKETRVSFKGVEFLWPHNIVSKSIKYSDLVKRVSDLIEKQGPDFTVPASLKNIESIYDRLTLDELLKNLDFDDSELEVIDRFKPEVYFSYLYSAKIWSRFNEQLRIRKGQSILMPGIQICANKMPQGEIIQVPLNRNIGRQNQILVLIHFENAIPDLGRKGFQVEVADISKTIGTKIINELINKYRKYLRVASGVQPDLRREEEVSDWKKEMENHERSKPLSLTNSHFFVPVNQISITSEPTREQDVIALFNQLLAGGVIRGLRIMSTNEQFAYDGMYRISFSKPDENYIYNEETNPLVHCRKSYLTFGYLSVNLLRADLMENCQLTETLCLLR